MRWVCSMCLVRRCEGWYGYWRCVSLSWSIDVTVLVIVFVMRHAKAVFSLSWSCDPLSWSFLGLKTWCLGLGLKTWCPGLGLKTGCLGLALKTWCLGHGLKTWCLGLVMIRTSWSCSDVIRVNGRKCFVSCFRRCAVVCHGALSLVRSVHNTKTCSLCPVCIHITVQING